MNFTNNYKDHDVDRAFTALQSNQPYSIESLGGAIIEFRQEVFVTDKLNFEFIKFCNEFIKNHSEIKNIADLGTGSGVIAVTLAKLHPNKNIAAFDISPKALKLAEYNAKKNKVSNIEFIKSKPHQWIPHEYKKPIELIISNPPFIGNEEWNDSNFLENFPDCKYQPLEALKTEDNYGVHEYIAITEAALKRKIKWIIFRLNGAYSDKLIASLQKYNVDAKLGSTPESGSFLTVKLP